MDRLDLLAVQGTLKSLLQHHGSKASILRCSAFFIVKLSHPYVTTGKTIALTRWTFVGKVVSLLFNIEINEDLFFEEKVCCVLCPQGIVEWIFHWVRYVITLDSVLPSLFRIQKRESSSSLQIMRTNQKKGYGETPVSRQCRT